MKRTEKKDKPLKKGICPQCLKKMHKLKKEWICYNCWTRVKYK
jgi:predicted amidophosphoribosyltransferase